ncbi:hypothetical protein BDV95DRAFT_597962 [Massariosphaeria phaeospora]|uniref:Uncharacterized protein n=1 Tax=Massariosphaeria phaeospora TaxID=100035 RepID=A0A7C8I2Q7_9PLEO|nr:hypothetical protein BDV95DRAFT_597962 [Massariosphaeria phaeospora]
MRLTSTLIYGLALALLTPLAATQNHWNPHPVHQGYNGLYLEPRDATGTWNMTMQVSPDRDCQTPAMLYEGDPREVASRACDALPEMYAEKESNRYQSVKWTGSSLARQNCIGMFLRDWRSRCGARIRERFPTKISTSGGGGGGEDGRIELGDRVNSAVTST